jgi:glycosyltransferase involved in cell wall biosynthesis
VKVAVLAPVAWRVPPRHYGPWEQFAFLLTEGLVKQGVDVTLFATGDSQTSATLRSVLATGYAERPDVDAKVWECLHISEVFERASDFDIIHNSFDFLPLTYSSLVATPVVTTIHGFSSDLILPVYEKYNSRTDYVAISSSDRRPSLDYIATIHHGIATDRFAVDPAPGPELLFFGRIHPEKGTAEAIQVARRAGRPLVIAGIIGDHRYFVEEVEPHVDGANVRYLGSIGPDERKELLGRSHALLHLIDFEEPFGFSVVESLASGTPVIAYRRGSMPELLDHGVNGFLVATPDEAVLAVEGAALLDRDAIRRGAVHRFGQDRMADDYLEVYRTILAKA